LETIKNNEFWNFNFSVIPGATEHDCESRRAELLREKFQIAGHSARFMFLESVDDINLEIKDKVLAMGGIPSLETAVRADRSAGAVNTLIARLQVDKNGLTPAQQAVLPTEHDLNAAASSMKDLRATGEESDTQNSLPRLVSDRATEEVLRTIPGEVEKLRGLARTLDNRAIEGYALEEQLKTKLREATQTMRSLIVLESNGKEIHLKASELKICFTETEIINELRVNQLPDTWIFIAGRQGAFDAIHIVSNEPNEPATDKRIRFVQLTAGKSHAFKLEIIDSIMTQLSPVTWSHLEFMIIRPVDDRRPFCLGKATGTLLQDYKRFDGLQWDRTDYRKNVQYATLDWK
jgi:hypothetical protein